MLLESRIYIVVREQPWTRVFFLVLQLRSQSEIHADFTTKYPSDRCRAVMILVKGSYRRFPESRSMSFYIVTLIIVSVAYAQLRKRPLRSYTKLKRSIDLYERQTTQIEAVKTRMQSVPANLTEQTLSAMYQRCDDLQRCIQGQWTQYRTLYDRPIYRLIFCLPPPPEFTC